MNMTGYLKQIAMRESDKTGEAGTSQLLPGKPLSSAFHPLPKTEGILIDREEKSLDLQPAAAIKIKQDNPHPVRNMEQTLHNLNPDPPSAPKHQLHQRLTVLSGPSQDTGRIPGKITFSNRHSREHDTEENKNMIRNLVDESLPGKTLEPKIQMDVNNHLLGQQVQPGPVNKSESGIRPILQMLPLVGHEQFPQKKLSGQQKLVIGKIVVEIRDDKVAAKEKIITRVIRENNPRKNLPVRSKLTYGLGQI